MKLTKPQKILLEVLKTESRGEENCGVEIEPHELRSAKSLERKGLIRLENDHIAVVNITKPQYPFEKVRKFLNEIYYLSINYRVHDLEKKIWGETQTIIKEIDEADSL